MIAVLLLAAALADDPAPAAPAPRAEAVQPAEIPASLLKMQRVFVDHFTGGETAEHIRDMIIASLQNAKLFVITENEQRADVFLRGAAEDLVFTDKFSSSEGVNGRSAGGNGRSTSSSSSSRGRYFNAGIGDNESTHIEERKHEAMAAVRLVNKDGDVIWSTTQESKGGKFRGASADVADKVTKQLLADIERARKPGTIAPPAQP